MLPQQWETYKRAARLEKLDKIPMAMIIDSEEKIARLIPAIEPMLREGLIAVSNVEVIKYVHDNARRE